jgi:hypothetical protein
MFEDKPMEPLKLTQAMLRLEILREARAQHAAASKTFPSPEAERMLAHLKATECDQMVNEIMSQIPNRTLNEE